MSLVILNSYSSTQLFASSTVLFLLSVVILAAILLNIFFIYKSQTITSKFFRIFFCLILGGLLWKAIKSFDVEYQLYHNPNLTTGITIGYCEEFAKGIGIETQYEVNEMTYSCCNTFHPLTKSEVIAIGGQYSVKYSTKYPEKGRVNFSGKSTN